MKKFTIVLKIFDFYSFERLKYSNHFILARWIDENIYVD